MALIDDIAGDFRWPRDAAWHGQPPVPLVTAMAQAGLPAVSAAVITGGEVSETAAWGVACAGEPAAATPGTLFQAASISKPVAAACALRLGAASGSTAGGALLPAELAALMIEPAAPNVRCGLGLFSEGSGGSLRFGHTGGNEGFVCELAGYAGAGIGAVVMTNADAGVPLVKGVLAAIARARAWPGYPAGIPRQPAAGTGDAAVSGGAAVAAGEEERRAGIALAGDYELGETVIRVREQDGLLTLQAGQQPPVALVLSGTGRWAALELNLEVRLAGDGAGEARPELVLRQDAPFTTEATATRRAGQAG